MAEKVLGLNLGPLAMNKEKSIKINSVLQQAYALYSKNYLYRYQGMKMKYVWHLVMPCLPIVLYNILNLLDVFGKTESTIPQSANISVGITFYYLFSESLIGFSTAIDSNKSYLFKTGVSFTSCYLSVLYSIYSNFIIRFIVIVVMLSFYDGLLNPSILLSVIYSIFPIVVGASIGLILSVFTVFYNDFNNFVQALAFYMLFGSGVFVKIDGDSMIEILFMSLPTYVSVLNAKSLIFGTVDFNMNGVVSWVFVCFLICVLAVFGIKNSKSLVINYLR